MASNQTTPTKEKYDRKERYVSMKSNITKSDTELKKDVLAEFEYEPGVNVTDIGVLVKDGAVTLNGYATSYGEKWDAVRVAKRVAGVKAIADDIEVKLPGSQRRTDGDIAAAAAHQINWSTTIPSGTVEVTVREGWITLEGEVEWWYQKNAAENVVLHLAGVKGVSNLITIKPKLVPAEIETVIKSAFERNALLDAKKIQVETSGNKVVLRGKVRNHAEREEAERAAWAAPGVFSVDNQLKVEWSWGFAE
jgi:osmotically-inducible protein OsmY